MSATLHSFVLIFAALFPIINPPGTALIFYASTRQASHADRAELAQRIALYAFIILNASLYIGAYVLKVFGVSVPVLRVAGGIVVILTAWKLLNDSGAAQDEIEKPKRGHEVLKAAFYPLTMPLTTGPGTIAVTIALGAGRVDEAAFYVPFVTGALLATVLISALIYFCYRFADRVETALGETTSDAIARLFAFILMCIGIEIFWAGLSELLAAIPKR